MQSFWAKNPRPTRTPRKKSEKSWNRNAGLWQTPAIFTGKGEKIMGFREEWDAMILEDRRRREENYRLHPPKDGFLDGSPGWMEAEVENNRWLSAQMRVLRQKYPNAKISERDDEKRSF